MLVRSTPRNESKPVEAILPDDAFWVRPGELKLGRANIPTLVDGMPIDSDSLEVLLAIAFRRRLSQGQLRTIAEAAGLSRRGDQVLANLRLALAGLSRVPAPQDLRNRLAMADMLLANGMTGADLLSELDLGERPGDDLAKFDPEEPRVPGGNGRESGWWTSGSGGSASGSVIPIAAPAIALRAAPLLATDLSAVTVAALSVLAASVGLAATLGVLFVPSPNAVATGGPLPGNSDSNYVYDHDEGLLRVLDAAGNVLVAGHKDSSGVFFDADTGLPFARELDGALMFDGAAMAAAKGKDDAEAAPIAVPWADTDTDEPKLCPEPGPDQPGSEAASPRAQAYQEQISRMINPQRPLDYGLAMNLVNPLTGNVVHFDECDEETGTMIEAKGPRFAALLGFEPARTNVTEDWLDQSEREINAAGTRRVEWYFAEQAAADHAAYIFGRYGKGRERIIIKVQQADQP